MTTTAFDVPEPEPMPPNIGGIQPGGGPVQALELSWGRVRRRLLKTFFPGYVAAQRQLLRGDPGTCPVEVIDSRDVKYFVNISDVRFEPDRFAWRDRLGVARAGLGELVLIGGGGVVLAAIIAALAPASGLWLVPLGLALFSAYFFRDPHRDIPEGDRTVVSPADGKIVDVAECDDPWVGPAVKIGIFLSVFNVHVNRCSLSGRLIRLTYRPGQFLNALKPSSAELNERLELYFVEPAPPHRRFVIRQISGAIARRIVCLCRTGELVHRGQRFGMIKFGSRTELLLPREGLELTTRVGETVQGGSSILGRYRLQ